MIALLKKIWKDLITGRASVTVVPKRRGRPEKYPLRSLKIGQSLLFTAATSKDANRIRAAVCSIGKRYPEYRFTTLTVPEGLRVTRIESEVSK